MNKTEGKDEQLQFFVENFEKIKVLEKDVKNMSASSQSNEWLNLEKVFSSQTQFQSQVEFL